MTKHEKISAVWALYDAVDEVVPALRKLAAECSLGDEDEGRDWHDMLIACADDLEAATAKARGE
jgi:hypothetical protein